MAGRLCVAPVIIFSVVGMALTGEGFLFKLPLLTRSETRGHATSGGTGNRIIAFKMQSPSRPMNSWVPKDRRNMLETLSTATQHLEDLGIEEDAHGFQEQQEQQRRWRRQQQKPKEYKVGVIVVDHGSRRKEANEALESVASEFKALSGYELVEPAHMELCEPSIATAFGRCVERGATFIICHPFFLSRGRHVAEDIPNLLEEAASIFPGVEWALSQPLGLQADIPRLMQQAIEECIAEKNIQSEDHADGLPMPEFNI